MRLAPALGGHDDVIVIHSGRLVRFDLLTQSRAYAIGPGFTGQPAIKDNVVYAISGNALQARDQDSGALMWSWGHPTELLRGAVVATEGHVIVHSNQTTFLIDLQTHLPVWTTPHAGDITLAEGAMYIAGANGQLVSIGFDALPTPAAVAPAHTDFLDAPIQVSVTGTGFTLGENLEVRFDGIAATEVTIVDD